MNSIFPVITRTSPSRSIHNMSKFARPHNGFPRVNLYFIGLHDEFQYHFEQFLLTEFSDSPRGTCLVREFHLCQSLSGIIDTIEATHPIDFVFDSITTPESFALAVKALEAGHTVSTFLPWIHRSTERRSAISLLLRRCCSNSDFLSSSELAMWTTMMAERLRPIVCGESKNYI